MKVFKKEVLLVAALVLLIAALFVNRVFDIFIYDTIFVISSTSVSILLSIMLVGLFLIRSTLKKNE